MFAHFPLAARFAEAARASTVQAAPEPLEPVPKPLDQSAIGLTEPDVEV